MQHCAVSYWPAEGGQVRTKRSTEHVLVAVPFKVRDEMVQGTLMAVTRRPMHWHNQLLLSTWQFGTKIQF